MKRAEQWLLTHFADSDGVGAIFPPMIYTVISLRCLGYADDSPEMEYALKQLDDLMIEEDDTIRLQPCFSPVWDTALALNALLPRRISDKQGAVVRATHWLLDREVRRPGDWTEMNPHLEPGGWFFEYRNGFYPDTDDTAMVLMALATGQAATTAGHPPAERALHWFLGMQEPGRRLGCLLATRHHSRHPEPFADHNAMLDPSCPDITARVLEALGQYGYPAGAPGGSSHRQDGLMFRIRGCFGWAARK